MASSLATTLILCAVSVVLLALGRFVRPISRVCGIVGLVWLAAALPVMLFASLDLQYVLLFYLISAAAGLILHFGGKPT